MLALRSLYRASKASSEVLLGFPATAAVPFSAVSVPLLAAAVASSSSALVPAASDSQAVRLSAGKSPSSCSKPPISAPATYPMAIFPGIPDTRSSDGNMSTAHDSSVTNHCHAASLCVTCIELDSSLAPRNDSNKAGRTSLDCYFANMHAQLELHLLNHVY